MNKTLLSLAILIGLTLKCLSQPINWQEIESYVAWFNAYESPGLLSLSIDNKPALRGTGPGTLYSRTKFPSGLHKISVQDSRVTGDIIDETLRIRESGNHLLITYGKTGECRFSLLHQSDFLDEDGHRYLFVVNAMNDGKLGLTTTNALGNTSTEQVDSTLKLRIRAEDQFKNLTLDFTAKTGQKRRENIELPPFDDLHGLILIAYLDPDDFEKIRFASIDPANLQLLSFDAPTNTED